MDRFNKQSSHYTHTDDTIRHNNMGICMSNHSVMAIDIESQSKGDPSSQRIATSATATKVNGHQVQPQQQIPNHHRSNNNAHDTTQGIVNADNSTHSRTAQQQQQPRSNHESTTTHPQSALMPSLGKRVLSTEALDRNENLLGTISLHSTSPSPTTTNATSNGVTTDTVFHQQQQLSPSNLQHQQQQQQGAPIQFPSSVSSSSAQPPYITTITPPSPQTQPSPSTMIITVNNVNSVPLPQIHRTSPTNNGSNTSGGGGGSSSGANSNYNGSNNIIINNNGLSTGDSRRAKPSPLHMMAVTNNLRNKEEIGMCVCDNMFCLLLLNAIYSMNAVLTNNNKQPLPSLCLLSCIPHRVCHRFLKVGGHGQVGCQGTKIELPLCHDPERFRDGQGNDKQQQQWQQQQQQQ